MNNFKRRLGESDEPEYIFVASTTNISATAANLSTYVTITSKYGEETCPYTIEGYSYVTARIVNNRLSITIPSNTDLNGGKSGSVVLKQQGSDKIITITITQSADLIKTANGIGLGFPATYLYTFIKGGDKLLLVWDTNLGGNAWNTQTYSGTEGISLILTGPEYSVTEYVSGVKNATPTGKNITLGPDTTFYTLFYPLFERTSNYVYLKNFDFRIYSTAPGAYPVENSVRQYNSFECGVSISGTGTSPYMKIPTGGTETKTLTKDGVTVKLSITDTVGSGKSAMNVNIISVSFNGVLNSATNTFSINVTPSDFS